MKIVVAGTGYVGLVAGVCFAEKGHDVTCVDTDDKKIKLMEAGISPIYEQGLEELMRSNFAAGRLHYTTDYKNAYKNPDAIFIGVGTPELPDGSANLGYIATVSRQIAENLEKMGLSATIRGEALSLQQFAEFADLVEEARQ